MDRPTTSISKSNEYHHVKTERPHSVASISYLRSDVKASSEPSWRSRVKSVELPGKFKKKTKFKPKPAANSMEGFDLDKYVESHPRDAGAPRICINGKPSDSPHSKTILRTLSRYKETGSKDQPAFQSDEEELLDEVFDLDLLSFNAGLHPLGAPKTPLCWEDVTLDPSKYNTDTVSTAQVEETEGLKHRVTPSDACQLSTSGCRPLSPLTSSVSIQCDNNPVEGCVLHAHVTSLLTVDVSLTWRDVCLLPWKPSPVNKHIKTLGNTDSKNRMRNGLCVDGLATASEEGQKRVEMLLKCMLLGTASSCNKGKDLMCIWLRLPSQGPSSMHAFKLESCVFDVYLSESSGQISTRILKKQSPVKVANNLFYLKFNLLSCLPWICDAESISGRNLEILLYLAQPDRYSGCIFQKSLHLARNTTTSSDGSPSQAGTSVPSKPDVDHDKMTLVVNDTEIDPSNGDVQDLIISLYENPYQLHKDKVPSPPSTNRSQTYTDIVHFHLEEFISNGRMSTHNGIIEPRQSSTRSQKQQGRQVRSRPLSTAKKTRKSGIISIPSQATQANRLTQEDNIVSKYYGQSISLATSSS